MRMNIRNHIYNRLANLQPRTLTSGYTREAAVLMPIFEKKGEPCFLLTRRTQEVQTHKGQISFPGGMRENGEDLAQTALRETHEEVGIQSHEIEILGRFHDYISITDYRVTPFAGFLSKPFTTTPQAHEVAEVIHVPIRIFLDPSRLRVEKQIIRGQEEDVYFYSYKTYQIWGLTARMIKDFLAFLRLEI
jgi:8-oxo-dGTP pyrophosphatase MutT (NUDIX family)